jgi:hypothetical protein
MARNGFVDPRDALVTASSHGRWTRLWTRHFGSRDPDQPSAEEAEASAILERVERELSVVEERTNRLMHQYGL